MPVDPMVAGLIDRIERLEEGQSRMRERMATYEAWHDNAMVQSSRSAAWLVAGLSAAIAIVGMVVNVWLSVAAP